MVARTLLWFAVLVSACEARNSISSRVLPLEFEGVDAEDVRGAVERVYAASDFPSEVVLSEELFDAVSVADEDATPDDAIWPEAPGIEVRCNAADEDGDGLDLCEPDLDGDGAPADLDCDDGDSGVSPLSPDLFCNGLDENCNGFDECDRDADGVLDVYDPDPDDPASRPERQEASRDVN
jgi:hypothetical protein